ncbi:hypothetical protein [Pseudomonas sp. 2FE]|uniref:hypothetical protein n=1 Tax=Pseudomonas sp. 2FE TaxID=2502190 RepID=UPI0010FA440E|nr:hypothetical protein [Pseudomonas sp. 2FE]
MLAKVVSTRRNTKILNRPLETGDKQVGYASDVVYEQVDYDQCLDHILGKFDEQTIGVNFVFSGGFRPLEQAAVNQQPVLGIHQELTAGAGHAVLDSTVQDAGIVHGVGPLTMATLVEYCRPQSIDCGRGCFYFLMLAKNSSNFQSAGCACHITIQKR